jgi:hypothetical protein
MMLRSALLALALLLPLPAAAQTAAPAPNIAAATRALSAMWRPMTGAASVETACRGATAEMDAVDAMLPPVLDQDSLAQVRTLRGLLVVPTDDPEVAYFFPDRTMEWFTPGMAAVAVVDEAQGILGIRDAGGRDIALQLGRGGDRPVLRIRNPEGQVLNFVGCAPTWGS